MFVVDWVLSAWGYERCWLCGRVGEYASRVDGGVSVDNNLVRDHVGVGVDWGRVVPVVMRPRECSVELGCLAGEADCCAGLMDHEQFDRERPEVGSDGGEYRLELVEPAAERFAATVPVMIWVLSSLCGLCVLCV